MSFFTIGDDDTVLGFSLAGVEGRVALNEAQVRNAFRSACARSDIKILIIEEKCAALIRDFLDAYISENDTPLVVEIPGSCGVSKDRIKIDELIRNAIGINL